MTTQRSSGIDLSFGDSAGSVSRPITESGSIEVVAPTILAFLATELNCDVAELWRISRRSGEALLLTYWATRDLEEVLASNVGTRLARGSGLPGRVVLEDAPSWVADVSTVSEPGCPTVQAQNPPAAAFTLPVRFGDAIVAALCFHGSQLTRPTGSRLNLLRTVGDQVGQFEAQSRAHAAIRRSEVRRAATIEAALDCIITVDHEGRIVEFNPAAVRTFGWEPGQVIGRKVADVLVPDSRRQTFNQLVERVSTMEGADGIRGERIEGRAVRRDGIEFPVELTVTRVDVAGPPIFIAYLRDITAAKASESEREQLLERERSARISAEDAQQRMSFLADASKLLASSLDLDEILRQVAKLVVPWLADWCAIDLLGPDGEIEPAAIEHPDPGEVAWAHEFRKVYPPSMSDEVGLAEVIRSGEPVLVESIKEAELGSAAKDASHLEELRRFIGASVMVVPLTTSHHRVGAITMLSVSPKRRFQPQDLEVIEELGRYAGLAIENARLYRDKSHIATTLQRSLLPPALPDLDMLDLAVRSIPAGAGYEVGGDFYDVFELDDGRCVLVVGDVQGKGPEAAALIGLVRHTLRTAIQYERDLDRILPVVNDAILSGKSGRLCTVALVVMTPDRPGCLIETVCAGHHQPIVLRSNGELGPVGGLGMVLGVFTDPPVGTGSDRLSPGDALALFSDGILITHDHAEGPFRSFELSASLTADAIAERVFSSVPGSADGQVRDDATLLVAKVRE